MFQPSLSTIKQCAYLSLHQRKQSSLCRPLPVPFKIKEAVEKELDRLKSAGILNKVDHTDWAAPFLLVPTVQLEYAGTTRCQSTQCFKSISTSYSTLMNLWHRQKYREARGVAGAQAPPLFNGEGAGGRGPPLLA